MARDGSQCCIFSFRRFQDFPQGSQSAWTKLCHSVGLQCVCWRGSWQRGPCCMLQDKTISTPASHLQCSGECLKELREHFFKINCYIFTFASWFLHPFFLSFYISKPFFRGKMSTNLQLKLWKWPWGLRLAKRTCRRTSLQLWSAKQPGNVTCRFW